MTIRSELEAIQGDSELLYPDDVWRWARAHPDSLLHKQYPWDIQKAAEAHWHWKSCQLIALHITYEDGMRSMVSLSIDRKGDGGYRRVDDVLPQKDLRDMMLADALRDLERLQAKYSRVSELTAVWAAKDQVKTRSRRRARLEAERPEARA